jgi:restriction system protein
MSIWLCRAGRFGEHEARFLENNKIYFTFEEIDKPLNSFSGRAAIQQYFLEKVPTLKERAALNFASQAHIFSSRMSVDDWVLLSENLRTGEIHE